MKIRITARNVFTPYGAFQDGRILTDANYPAAFLSHLVNDCGAAEFLEYETKIITEIKTKPAPKPEIKKKTAKKKGKKTAKKSG